MERDDENRMSAVERTMLILETLSKAEAINLENMAKMTALPKATLLRFLSSLISLGYVYRDSADQYHLTLKMFMVGSRSLSHIDLVSTAKPFAKKLSQELGETVHMGILEDDEAVYVLKEESSYTLRMYSRVGKIIPLYCTAIGKVFLSEMSDEELDGYLTSMRRLYEIYSDVRSIGSAALSLCYLASGRVSCYYERLLHIYDVAAGLLIAKEAGAEIALDCHDSFIDVIATSRGLLEKTRDAIDG